MVIATIRWHEFRIFDTSEDGLGFGEGTYSLTWITELFLEQELILVPHQCRTSYKQFESFVGMRSSGIPDLMETTETTNISATVVEFSKKYFQKIQKIILQKFQKKHVQGHWLMYGICDPNAVQRVDHHVARHKVLLVAHTWEEEISNGFLDHSEW